jgi:hypothetical protein
LNEYKCTEATPEVDIILPSNKFNFSSCLTSSNKSHQNNCLNYEKIEEKMVYPCNVKPCNVKKSVERVASKSPIKNDDFFEQILKQKAAKKQVSDTKEVNYRYTTDSLKPSYTINRKIDEIYHLMNNLKVSSTRYNKASVPKTKTQAKYFQYDKPIFNATDKELYLQSIKKNLEHFTHKKQEIQNNRKDHFESFDEKIEMLKKRTKMNDHEGDKLNKSIERNDNITPPYKVNENKSSEKQTVRFEIPSESRKINEKQTLMEIQPINDCKVEVGRAEHANELISTENKDYNKFEVIEEPITIVKKNSLTTTRSINSQVENNTKEETKLDAKEETKVDPREETKVDTKEETRIYPKDETEQNNYVKPKNSSKSELPNYDDK